MNHKQIEKSGMYKKMLLFFANPVYSNIWASFIRLANEIENFVALNARLSNYVQLHHSDISGVKESKDNSFIAMVNLLINKAQRAYVWAMDTNNDKLTGIFDISRSNFTHVPEVKAFAMVKNVRDALSSNIASMASVQLAIADVDALNLAIKEYEDKIGTTGAAQSVKTSSTIGIEEIIQSIDKSLGIIDKLMDSTYSESQMEMIKEFWINRNVDKLPTHHSGIYLHVTDDATGADLKDALLTLNGKSATSDIDGIAEINIIKPGTYMATVSLAGYAEQTVKVVITKGKVTELEIKMVK